MSLSLIIAIFVLSISFISSLLEKLTRKRNEGSDYSGFPKKVRNFLLMAQLICFCLGIYLLIQGDSDSTEEKEKLRMRISDLRNENDSVHRVLNTKLDIDTTRLKLIIDSLDTVSHIANKSLIKTNQTLLSAREVLNKVNVSSIDILRIKNISESTIFPLFPMRINVSFTMKLKKDLFEKICPLYSESRLSKRTSFGYNARDKYRFFGINLSDVSQDSLLKDFMLNNDFWVIFEKVKGHQSDSDAANGGGDSTSFSLNINDLDYKESSLGNIRFDSVNAIIKMDRTFIFQESGNHSLLISGAKEAIGWYFTLGISKRQPVNFHIDKIYIVSGINGWSTFEFDCKELQINDSFSVRFIKKIFGNEFNK